MYVLLTVRKVGNTFGNYGGLDENGTYRLIYFYAWLPGSGTVRKV